MSSAVVDKKCEVCCVEILRENVHRLSEVCVHLPNRVLK
jgi:hypothetical protein